MNATTNFGVTLAFAIVRGVITGLSF